MTSSLDILLKSKSSNKIALWKPSLNSFIFSISPTIIGLKFFKSANAKFVLPVLPGPFNINDLPLEFLSHSKISFGTLLKKSF